MWCILKHERFSMFIVPRYKAIVTRFFIIHQIKEEEGKNPPRQNNVTKSRNQIETREKDEKNKKRKDLITKAEQDTLI